MITDSIYHFGADMAAKAIICDGVEDLTHHEVAGTLTATIPGDSRPQPGEMLGFLCVDGRFRLFCITDVEYEDDTGQASCKAMDAAWQELAETIIPGERQLLDVTALQAVESWLDGTDWQIGSISTGEELKKLRSYYQDLRTILGSIQTAYSVRITPYYAITGNRISGRYVDIEPDSGTYRGRLVESGYDADKVSVTYSGVPITAVYPLGKRLGTEETSPRLTIAEAAWSRAGGDPADKPAGQDWIGDDVAAAEYGRQGTHRFATAVFDDIEDADALISAAWEYLQTVNRAKERAEASLYDIEVIQGTAHAAIRAGDIIRLRSRHHVRDVEAKIVEIKRNYADPSRTTFEIGDKAASAAAIVSALNVNAQHTKETLTLYRNKFIHDEALIALHAEVISLTSDRVTELVTGQEGLRSYIQLLEDSIELKVEADKVISAINMSPETITISAEKINLEGYVKAENLEAEMAEIFDLWAEEFSTKKISADNVICGYLDADEVVCGPLGASSLTLGGTAMGLISDIQVCTRSATYYSNTADISYLDWDGNKRTATFATGIAQAQTPSHRTISYIGPA